MRLPGADELFRPTTTPAGPEATSAPPPSEAAPSAAPAAPAPQAAKQSGRVKHDSKVTVYMTSDELLDLEHARLELRRDLGQTLDRGRLIREAVAMALAEYAENGLDGELARRLGAS